MSKAYQQDPELVADVAKKTAKIEEKYRQQQAQKRQKRVEKEELEQRHIAPILLIVTLLLGWLVSVLF